MQHDASSFQDTRFYAVIRRILKALCFVLFPSRMVGAEKLEGEAPFIITANHQSLMDPILLAVHVKRHQIHFLGKDSLRRVPVLRWLVDHLHMIPVNRKATDIAAMRRCLAALKAGRVVGIYPEGTRKEQTMMEEMGSGIGLVALRSGVPLYPVYYDRKPRLFRTTRLVVGDAIGYEDLKRRGTNKETCEMLSERIKNTTYALRLAAPNK